MTIEPWLLHFMIGDAYGAGFEFRPRDYVTELNDGITYRSHELDTAQRPGTSTDDTQMTLAVLSVMTDASPASAFDPRAYARAFIRLYSEEPAVGYGRRMRDLLPLAAQSSEPERFLIDSCRTFTTKDTNGAAMRAIPCGRHARRREDAALASLTQARVTHHHPDSIDAAVVVGLVAFEPSSIDTALDSVGWPTDWHASEWGGATTRGKDTVRAVLGLLKAHDSLGDILKHAIALGGDVDTVAALALGLGTLAGKKDDLPQSLKSGLRIPRAAIPRGA